MKKRTTIKTLLIMNGRLWVINMQTLRNNYLKILAEKEEEADHNLKETFKKYQQAKQIKAAATRDRMAWEEGMGK